MCVSGYKSIDHESGESSDDEDEHDDADDVGAASEVVGEDGFFELVILWYEGLLESASLFAGKFICFVHS